MTATYRIIYDCPDRSGIVGKVASLLSDHGGWILDAAHHSDHESNWFFSRLEVRADSLPYGLDKLSESLQPLVNELSMNLRLVDASQKKKVVLMASKSSHCLSDLLDRWRSRDLDCDIVSVIANHDIHRGLVEWYGIPYHLVEFDPADKTPAFSEADKLIEQYQADTVVLARFMQILPADLCEKYRHQIINIHHSFLPSFIGARPYHQAWQRGVKLVGATCHYVTENLDQGPIIAQDAIHISHGQTANDLVRRGKDVEKSVLARGLSAHLEDRVMVHGNRTVVFD